MKSKQDQETNCFDRKTHEINLTWSEFPTSFMTTSSWRLIRWHRVHVIDNSLIEPTSAAFNAKFNRLDFSRFDCHDETNSLFLVASWSNETLIRRPRLNIDRLSICLIITKQRSFTLIELWIQWKCHSIGLSMFISWLKDNSWWRRPVRSNDSSELTKFSIDCSLIEYLDKIEQDLENAVNDFQWKSHKKNSCRNLSSFFRKTTIGHDH